MSYLIISFTYREHKINSHIEYIKNLNAEIKEWIDTANKLIKYKSSKAYKNKILKEQQSMKNIWEEIIYIVEEDEYKKFTEWEVNPQDLWIESSSMVSLTDTMNIFQKWIYFIFKKDIR